MAAYTMEQVIAHFDAQLLQIHKELEGNAKALALIGRTLALSDPHHAAAISRTIAGAREQIGASFAISALEAGLNNEPYSPPTASKSPVLRVVSNTTEPDAT